MANFETLEKDIVNGKIDSLYLLYGPEKYLLESIVKRIKKQFGELTLGINYIEIDDSSIAMLYQELQTPPFGYDKKLIIVKNSGIVKKEGKKKNTYLSEIRDNIVEFIKNNMEDIIESQIVIFIEEETEKNTLYKLIDEKGTVCEFPYLKPDKIIARLKKVCALYNVQATDETLKYLLEVSGTNMLDLMNEIRKQIEFAGEDGKITKEAIDKIAIKQIESVIFELTDNLGNRNITAALEVLNNLIYQKEPVQKILITLYNHFKKLYLVHIAEKTHQDIAIALQLKPNQTFLVNKYKRQANYFNEKELYQILKELIDLDYNFKSGKIDLDTGLRSILCVYCS